MRDFFSATGRWNRSKVLGAYGIGLAVIFVFAVMVVPDVQDDDAAGLFTLVFLALTSMPIVKRLHDLDRSGFHFWLLLIPFYNLYLAALLLFAKGTSGPNRFGPDPLAVARSQAAMTVAQVQVASVVSQPSPIYPAAPVPGSTSCTNCGAASVGSRFCPQCGHPISAPRTCSGCGAIAGPEAVFCTSCGSQLISAT